MDVMMLDSITDAGPFAAGCVVASGSHGGTYPAAVASRAGVRAVAFNDSGVGFERAGIAGVMRLAEVGMAAVAADCMSCHIGDARDLARNGRVSAVNAVAEGLGIAAGMAMARALELLAGAPEPSGMLDKVAEARRIHRLPNGAEVDLLDSASLVKPEDEGRILITGSHGALIGGDPARALKARARIAVFNDAGIGLDGIGITRLPALDERGVAAVTVSASSCRIGDAWSAYETGMISHVNRLAAKLDAAPEMPLASWLAAIA